MQWNANNIFHTLILHQSKSESLNSNSNTFKAAFICSFKQYFSKSEYNCRAFLLRFNRTLLIKVKCLHICLYNWLKFVFPSLTELCRLGYVAALTTGLSMIPFRKIRSRSLAVVELVLSLSVSRAWCMAKTDKQTDKNAVLSIWILLSNLHFAAGNNLSSPQKKKKQGGNHEGHFQRMTEGWRKSENEGEEGDMGAASHPFPNNFTSVSHPARKSARRDCISATTPSVLLTHVLRQQLLKSLTEHFDVFFSTSVADNGFFLADYISKFALVANL